MTLRDLAHRARVRVDSSGVFDRVVREDVVTDFLTGVEQIQIVAEIDLDARTGNSQEVTLLFAGATATERSVDDHVDDTLIEFDRRAV